METLWDKLKPEYKQIIEHYIEDGQFTAGPRLTKRFLESKLFFNELTINELQSIFTWTDNDVTTIVWQDLFGDRFLIEEK